jgi:hypothetical protein
LELANLGGIRGFKIRVEPSPTAPFAQDTQHKDAPERRDRPDFRAVLRP